MLDLTLGGPAGEFDPQFIFDTRVYPRHYVKHVPGLVTFHIYSNTKFMIIYELKNFYSSDIFYN